MEGEFNLTGTLFKRLGAYVFDIIIVSMLVSLLSYLPILNPPPKYLPLQKAPISNLSL